MFKDYWGELGSGRLKGPRFALLWIGLIVLFFVCAMLVGASIGLAEKMIGGDIAEAQNQLRQNFSLPAILAVTIGGLLFLLAKLNLIAKRARDIGLPGWLSAVIIAGLIGATAQGSDAVTGGGLGMLVLIIMIFIPSDSLRKRG